MCLVGLWLLCGYIEIKSWVFLVNNGVYCYGYKCINVWDSGEGWCVEILGVNVCKLIVGWILVKIMIIGIGYLCFLGCGDCKYLLFWLSVVYSGYCSEEMGNCKCYFCLW